VNWLIAIELSPKPTVMNATIPYKPINVFSEFSHFGGAGKSTIEEPFRIALLNPAQLGGIYDDPVSLKQCKNFELYFVRKGVGTLQIGSHEVILESPCIHFFGPGNKRRFIPSSDMEGFLISFSPDFIHLAENFPNQISWIEELAHFSDAIVVPLNDEMDYELEFIARKMLQHQQGLIPKTELLKGWLNVFLLYINLSRIQNTSDLYPSREAELVKKFFVLLKRFFVSKKMVIDYANELFVTPNYLNRTVKKATGYTASYHIQQKIVIEAKRQAQYSSISMKEIAYNLGFDNLAHFSKFFKNNCGVNFTDFKKGLARA
jgi:AraC family transcriptional activator of pobA